MRVHSRPASLSTGSRWTCSRRKPSTSVRAVWIQTALTDVDGFRRLQVHLDPVDSDAGRECTLILRLQAGAVPIGEIKVVQAGASSGN